MFYLCVSVGGTQASGVNYIHAKSSLVHLINTSTSDQVVYSRTFSIELTEQ